MEASPQTIPGYVITKKLGVGGLATVFLAKPVCRVGTGREVENHNRLVALKILHPQKAEEPLALERFLHEANLLIRFSHPHIVKGYRAERTAQGLYFLAMEYIEGDSVYRLIEQRGRLAEPEAIEITLQLARALEYMQSQGFVHRDLKPDNVLLTKARLAKLCDLGLAQPITQVEGVGDTTSGTAHYMSPEQATGQRDLDIRSDIYSLGVTLYHMLMGKVPFSGAQSDEIMAQQVLEALNSAEVKNRGISQLTHYFIERMMAKEKELRYASPTELMADIQTHLEGYKALEFKSSPAPSKVKPSLSPPVAARKAPLTRKSLLPHRPDKQKK